MSASSSGKRRSSLVLVRRRVAGMETLRSRGTVDRGPLYKGIVSDDPERARPGLGAGGESVGKGGGEEGYALEHPSGCECAPLRRFGAAHQRVHRYLRTSLHGEQRSEDQCSVGNQGLEQPRFREAQIALCTEDKVVVHGNVQ